MCRASSKLPQRNEFFGLHQLRLKPLQILQRLLGAQEQASAIRLREMRSHENQRRQRQGGDHRGNQPEIANVRFATVKVQAIQREKG